VLIIHLRPADARHKITGESHPPPSQTQRNYTFRIEIESQLHLNPHRKNAEEAKEAQEEVL
jgi:hypothetical protein